MNVLGCIGVGWEGNGLFLGATSKEHQQFSVWFLVCSEGHSQVRSVHSSTWNDVMASFLEGKYPRKLHSKVNTKGIYTNLTVLNLLHLHLTVK